MRAHDDRRRPRSAAGRAGREKQECALLRIESLAAGGDGVAHLPDGRVIFVPLTAPGDRALVRLTDVRKRFARGEVEDIREPSPDRVAPRCEMFGRCGGCAWQHLSYESQIEAKRAILVDALVRIGGCEPIDDLSFLPSPDAYGYRGRARLLQEGGEIGYRERRSHRLCAVRSCPVLTPPLEAELERLADDLGPAEKGRSGPVTGEWELFAGSDGGTRSAQLPSRDRGKRRIALHIGGDEIGFSPGTFAQANALLLEPLFGAVMQAARHGDHVLELFAGAGFFTLGLARRFRRVTAVEGSTAAVTDLERNLEDASLSNVEVIGGRVEDALDRHVASSPEVVVLDPPRTGLAQGGAQSIAELRPSRVVYLSCDPATLARDIAQLRGHGYRLESALGIDLFPQTPHVEALVTLAAATGCGTPSGG